MPGTRCSKTDAIRSLIDGYAIEEALCVELIARRYRTPQGLAARDHQRVATILGPRQTSPLLPPPANVAEARRPGVSAMLPYFYERVIPALLRPLASRFAKLLGHDAEAQALA